MKDCREKKSDHQSPMSFGDFMHTFKAFSRQRTRQYCRKNTSAHLIP